MDWPTVTVMRRERQKVAPSGDQSTVVPPRGSRNHLNPRTHITNEPERASTYKCEHKQTLTSTYARKSIERRKHTAKFSVRWRSSLSLPKNTEHTYQTQKNTNSYFSLKNRQAVNCIRWCSISFVRARLCLLMRPHWFVHARLFKFVCACLDSFVICVRGFTDSRHNSDVLEPSGRTWHLVRTQSHPPRMYIKIAPLWKQARGKSARREDMNSSSVPGALRKWGHAVSQLRESDSTNVTFRSGGTVTFKGEWGSTGYGHVITISNFVFLNPVRVLIPC
jgi:hypothetical protein